MRQDGEPSVEEILDSIKRVIARDNREIMQPTRRRAHPDPAHADENAAEPADEEEAEEILELQEMLEASEAQDAGSDEGLTTKGTADAMRQSLAALAMLSEPGAPPQIVRSGETSLEGLVREMLRPMLAQWLEDNLPKIVEEQVKAEISRIAGKKR